MEQQNTFNTQHQYAPIQHDLPNATAVLVLGIVSIVMCGIGLVTGIIALTIANKSMRLYAVSPESYTQSSVSNTKTGKICALVGLILSALVIVFYIIYFIFIFSMISNAGGFDPYNNYTINV